VFDPRGEHVDAIVIQTNFLEMAHLFCSTFIFIRVLFLLHLFRPTS